MIVLIDAGATHNFIDTKIVLRMHLETKHFDEIIERRAIRDIEYGTPLSWDMVE